MFMCIVQFYCLGRRAGRAGSLWRMTVVWTSGLYFPDWYPSTGDVSLFSFHSNIMVFQENAYTENELLRRGGELRRNSKEEEQSVVFVNSIVALVGM